METIKAVRAARNSGRGTLRIALIMRHQLDANSVKIKEQARRLHRLRWSDPMEIRDGQTAKSQESLAEATAKVERQHEQKHSSVRTMFHALSQKTSAAVGTP